jgi:hypothetical protein
MLADEGRRDVRMMASALRRLPEQPRPSEVVVPGLLDGLRSVNRLTGRWLKERAPVPQRHLSIATSG